MVSTCEITFNIDGSTINLMLNIIVQKSLFSFSNVSSHSLNWFTCQYKQLQLVIMDEISLIGVRMFNVINNRLMSIKHIKYIFLACFHGIITCDFYQSPLVKDSWIFQNIKDNINALTLFFGRFMFNVINKIKLCNNIICFRNKLWTNFILW